MSVYNEVSRAVDVLYEQEGPAWTAGFLTTQLVAAIDQLPKTKQKMFLAQLERLVGDKVTVTVKNILSGQDVEIRWDERGTCVDPSTERYHTM